MKCITVFAALITLILSLESMKVETYHSFEYSILVLLAVAGMLCLVSSYDLLSLYLAIELQSLCLYVLAAYRRNSDFSTEAGLKYFVLGAFSSGILLFGCSMIYGFTGATNFGDIALLFSGSGTSASFLSTSSGVLIGVLFVGVSLLFKMTAVPFHMWAPDVYEGAPTSVTAFFAITPKVVILAIFLRFYYFAFYDLFATWQQLMILSAFLSLTVATFAAFYQRKIKRLLAYSSIGHVGYMLLAISCGSLEGVQGLIMYIVIYIAMMSNIFGLVLALRRQSDLTRMKYITDLKSLAKSNPLMAITFALSMFSIAGIPPLAGFYSKMYVFLAAMESELILLAIVAVLCSVVSSFYYMRIIKIMYFEKVHRWDFYQSVDREKSIVLACSIFFLVFFFLYPSPLLLFSHKCALLLAI